MKIIEELNQEELNIPPGLLQPSDTFYSNIDTAYWVKNPELLDDGTKEVKNGTLPDKNAEAKFKFLM